MAGKDIEGYVKVVTLIATGAVAVAVTADKLVKIVTGDSISDWFKKAAPRNTKSAKRVSKS